MAKMTRKELRALKKEMKRPPDPKEFMVEMADLTSEEVYELADGTRRPVLTGNSLTVRRGESWGIVGDEPFESELLLEIIGCVRSYKSGRCRLVERGMMRKKRKILPHVFFVGDPESTIPNMTTLEYLMYVTSHTNVSPRERQIAILEMLLEGGLYDCTLTPLKFLTKARQSVIALTAAYFSGALLILYSAGAYAYDTAEIGMLALLSRKMRLERRSLIIASSDCAMVQAVCSHCAFLVGGRLNHQGAITEVLDALDHRLCMVKCAEPERLMTELAPLMPECRLVRRGEWVDVYWQAERLSQPYCLEALRTCNVPLDVYRVSEPTLRNAFLEATSQHDL